MTTRDYNTYLKIFDLATGLIARPDLLIYLKASVPTLIHQIRKRGRAYEMSIQEESLERLNRKYEEWIGRNYDGEILTIDVDHTDLSPIRRRWTTWCTDRIVQKYRKGMTLPLPELFRSRTTESLGASEAERLFAALDNGESPVSIRFNPYKIGSQPEGRQVPWCRYGYYLDERPQFTLEPGVPRRRLLRPGSRLQMFARSNFQAEIFEPDCRSQDTRPVRGPRRRDDASFDPGRSDEGLVVASEVIRQRASVLAANAVKWGIGNIVVTNNDPAHFAPFEHYFDLIAVDAPCSGEGMFRKDPAARTGDESEQGVKLCAARQRRILSDIWGSLRPGGILIYSTCTFNAAENEENIAWLCGEYDCEPVANRRRSFMGRRKRRNGRDQYVPVLSAPGEGRRLFRSRNPQKRRTAAGTYAEAAQSDLFGAQSPRNRHPVAMGGPTRIHALREGQRHRLRLLPGSVRSRPADFRESDGHPFGHSRRTALRREIQTRTCVGPVPRRIARETVPQAEFDLPQTLDYLRKNEIDPSLLQEGINMVCYNGLPLGWIKRIGGRCNDLYPKESRIAAL